ncbi:hypothetical protein A0256_19810 [Mucilaginibacter sp. PAMC 26640]|nr:hypothetical protein A0256_19810 [Mucilaginibacter sp. PAMC 26640]
MKNFNITCNINNESQKFKLIFRQSAIASFYIYKNNKWIGTLCRNDGDQYRLISYSRFSISQIDVDAIGKQIDRQTCLQHLNPNKKDLVLRAA